MFGLRYVIFGLCLLMIVGCTGDPDRYRIVGDWELAVAGKLVDQVNAGDVDQSDAEDTPPKMVIYFYRSGSLKTQTNMGTVQSEKRGSWKFISYDDQSKKAKIECRMMDETTEFDVVVEDENTIRLVPPNMAGLTRKMKFVRR
jgi:hypothetical protein